MLLTLTTNCDGGALVTTQRIHFYLILSLILRGGRVALVHPNMRRNMVPWSIRRVADLPPHAKLRKMQEIMDGLAQLLGAAMPNVPSQAPIPQASKQLLNACPVPPMYIIIALLAGCQSSFLSSNEWHNDMNPAFLSTIMASNFKIKEITSATRRTIPIPNENISECPKDQGANPYHVAQHTNGNCDLENM